MSASIIQVDYQQLAQIAQRLAQQAAVSGDLRQQFRNAYEPLADGGWQGRGVAAFTSEMQRVIFPALERLTGLLEDGSATTLAIAELLRAAESEAAGLFGAQADAMLFGSGTARAFEPGNAFTLTSAGADGMFSSNTSDLSPLSPWATAPFVEGASVLGPGPVPIFGPHGSVPAGYTGAGSRLWLYPGGSGTDTLFSISRYAGPGRAPFHIPKPNLRLDYGPINISPHRTAFFPDGSAVRVPGNTNMFHWNQAGANGQIGQPLFRSFGGPVLNDHQLLSGTVPRGNGVGAIPGATIVRGASRGLFVVGAGMDVLTIATAEDRVAATARVAGGWGGAWLGAKGGATAGAAIGTFFGPGIGTAVGGFVGGVGGGAVGYVAGSEFGGWLRGLVD